MFKKTLGWKQSISKGNTCVFDVKGCKKKTEKGFITFGVISQLLAFNGKACSCIEILIKLMSMKRFFFLKKKESYRKN